MGNSWSSCQSCGHRYGSWISACPQCGSKNVGFKKGLGKGKKIAIGAGIAAAAFFAFVFLVAAFSPQPQSESVSSTQTTNQESAVTSSVIQTTKEASQETAARTQTPKTVRVNDLTFKITNATQDARKITVIVNVENNGQRIEIVSWLDFRLIDGQKNLYEDARAFPPDHGQLAAEGEIAPSANRDFKYVFVVPEGVQMTGCRLVVLENSNYPEYLDLV